MDYIVYWVSLRNGLNFKYAQKNNKLKYGLKQSI